MKNREYRLIIAVALVSALAGCGSQTIGGDYATVCYDRDTAQRIQPRVVIAFYDHHEDVRHPDELARHWGRAVGSEAGRQPITYPGIGHPNWEPLSGVPDDRGRDVFPGVCVLAEGYWPSIQTAKQGPDTTAVPKSLCPGLYGRRGLDPSPIAEPIPPECDGVWRVLAVPSTTPYVGLVASHTQSVPARFLGTIDAALKNSKGLTPVDREWAYGRLLNMIEAQLAVERDGDKRASLEQWARTFGEQASKLQKKSSSTTEGAETTEKAKI